MARVLVTGADGLVGRELLRQLAGCHEAWAISRQHHPDRDLGATWIRHDLSRPSLPEDMPAQIDTVFYLAQSRRFRDFPAGAKDIFDVNLGGLMQCLDWAQGRGVRRFVFASSGGVYGSGVGSFSEDSLVPSHEVLGFYLASKRCGELLAESYCRSFVVNVIRPFFIYGPGQSPDMLIPRLIRNVSEGRPIQLQGRDGLTINPVHVSDAARALAACLNLVESQKINVAGPEVLTLREVGEIIGEIVERRPVFEQIRDRPPTGLVGDISKMSQLLCAPRINFRAGVSDLWHRR